MSAFVGQRGASWFAALTGGATVLAGDPPSLLCADAPLGDGQARFLCVVPNRQARYPRARNGEVGLEEAYALAHRVHEVVEEDAGRERRPIVAIVDVKSQAYGRREEMAAIFLAAASAVDAFGSARLAGHPIVTLVVGHALSGGFLTHGYQANRILAFDDDGVMIHAMHEEAAARIMRRPVESLRGLAKSVLPLSYDIGDYARLGLLFKLLHVESPDVPVAAEVRKVKDELARAVKDIVASPSRDLSSRHLSSEALAVQGASLRVREALKAQWAAE